MMALNEDRFYSPAEVAEYLSVNVQTVRRWIQAGELGTYRIGRFWRVSREQVEEFLKAHEVSELYALDVLPTASNSTRYMVALAMPWYRRSSSNRHGALAPPDFES